MRQRSIERRKHGAIETRGYWHRGTQRHRGTKIERHTQRDRDTRAKGHKGTEAVLCP